MDGLDCLVCTKMAVTVLYVLKWTRVPEDSDIYKIDVTVLCDGRDCLKST